LDNPAEPIRLRSTRAETNRTPGTGDVATNIELIQQQPSTISNNNDIIEANDSSISMESSIQNIPRRRPSSASRSAERTPTRQRRQNIDYGIGNAPMLPPSTSQRNSMNFNNMFAGFHNMANTLNILAHSNRFRRVSDIHNDIIKTIRERQEMENSEVVNQEILAALTNKIAALN
jgi:hypothetical protein